ncbi:hypothetical protein SAY86_019061 [Trapa natans]|uniref:RING-type domain-containing protein n=1 Tax=Trapa natans TaxID=22666 RepID=A0AAN7LBE9_TRANT|nr:hypothetical protein SAY86_019061 [Trapa natans]
MGFDNECILSIQSLAGEYFCPVCRLLVCPNEALQSQCTHLYCKPCLGYIANSSKACPYDGYLVTEADSKPLIESNKALAETINKIGVCCLYHRSGCPWKGPLLDCITHCSGCAFGNSPVVCNKCGVQIVHRQVQDHAQSCPGVQPPAQKAVPSQEASSASAADANLSQISKPSVPASSQAQTTKPVNEAAVTTPELWYQQQYHQYYQHYAGYATCNPQYQQYYQQQLQQEAVQPQPYPQSQPQLQPQKPPQPQLQGPVSSHLNQQPPTNVQQPTLPSQTQVQAQPYGQPQVNLHLQAQSQIPAAPLALPPNQHQQLQLGVLSYPQVNPSHSHTLQYPQHPVQTLPQLQSQPPVHQHPPHTLPLPNSHIQLHSQAQVPGSVPNPLGVHNMHHPQQNVTANSMPQPQVQPVHAVPGYQSYPLPHPSSQSQLGAPQQHLVPTRPPQQLQQSVQVQGQGLVMHSSSSIRPTSVHAMLPNKQNLGLSQPPSSTTNLPTAQQTMYQHFQQPGQMVSTNTVMHPVQQQISQPTSQQVQPALGGQPRGLAQNQLYQQHPFSHQQILMQPQTCPRVPTLIHHLQSQQSLEQSHSSQNLAGGFPIPNHGLTMHVSPRPPGTVQVRPTQPSLNQWNLVGRDSQVKSSPEEQLASVSNPMILERSAINVQPDMSSQNTTKLDDKFLGDTVGEMNTVKSEMDTRHLAANHKVSETQEASKRKIARQETAHHEIEACDAKSEKQNKECHLPGHVVKQNESYQEQVENDTSLDLEPLGSENMSSATHNPDDFRTVPSIGNTPAYGVELPPSQQRAAAPSVQLAPPGVPHELHLRGQPIDLHGHSRSRNLLPRQITDQVLSPFSKQPFDPVISTGLLPDHGSLPSFGRGQSQLQCQYAPVNQGNLLQRMPSKSLGEVPPGALEGTGGMFISEKCALNGVEKLTETRPLYTDIRTHSNLQESLGRGSQGPFGRINKPPGVDFPFDQEVRLKILQREHMPSSVDLTPQIYDNRSFKAELKGMHDPIAKYKNHRISGSCFDESAFEMAIQGLDTEGSGSTSSRMFPPYGCNAVSRKRPFGSSEDNIERFGLSHTPADVLGFVPSYIRNDVEGSLAGMPGEHDGLPLRSLRGPTGISHGSLGSDDIMRRETYMHDGSIGRPFPESRLQVLPGHLNKSRLDYPENFIVGQHLRNGDMMGHDLPSHVRRHELLGPRNLHRGEHSGFPHFRGHVPGGEPVGPEVLGGRLGFERSLSFQRHSTDGYKSKEPFDDLRMRRMASTGWCRICKVDCDTFEGLDLHSQTREHQKVAIDIVRSIKQQNAKKKKLISNGKSTVEGPRRSRAPDSEIHGKNH